MKELIDKAAVVAVIERIRTHEFYLHLKEDACAHRALDMVLGSLNTLEVKEVDLEKEMGKYLDVNDIEFGYQIKLLDFATHFYELGLKARG